MRRTYRQGDVLVREVDTRDFAHHGVEVIGENGRIILARGEVSGHMHSIDARLARCLREPDRGFATCSWTAQVYWSTRNTPP
jgi:hypothetical protein